MDLEVEVTAGADGVAGFTDRADPLALEDELALADLGRARHVGVEVAALLGFAVDQREVAVEHRVVTDLPHPAIADRDQRRAAGGGDVEAFVDAAAVAGRVKGPDRTALAVAAPDREDVAVVGSAAVAGADLRLGRSGEQEQQRAADECGAPQSLTLKTRLAGVGSGAAVGPIAFTLKLCRPSLRLR